MQRLVTRLCGYLRGYPRTNLKPAMRATYTVSHGYAAQLSNGVQAFGVRRIDETERLVFAIYSTHTGWVPSSPRLSPRLNGISFPTAPRRLIKSRSSQEHFSRLDAPTGFRLWRYSSRYMKAAFQNSNPCVEC